MLSKLFLGWVSAAALGLGFDGAADVARIREELRKKQPDAAARADDALTGGWLETLWQTAAQAQDDDARFAALLLAMQVSEFGTTQVCKEGRGKARDELLARFADDPKRMGELLRVSSTAETREAMLARTAHKGVKALCLWSEAAGYLSTMRREKLGEEAQKRLDVLMGLLRGEYKDELDSRGRRFGDVVEGRLRAMNDLAVGKVAPDIEGKDLDGAPFKLSDYRGKIVVLDFWGHW
ncbi:MAG: redoxin domain-containing protein [Planctomycetes bacterium]|nr:redoxin domain-containing protein [Planctomycetota bacterium]